MSEISLQKRIGRVSSTAASDAEKAHLLLGRMRDGVSTASAHDQLELRLITAMTCQAAAKELNREMVADEELSLETRLLAATTLVTQSWVMSYRPVGPAEFEGLIEQAISTDDAEACMLLGMLFHRVCENEALWSLWKQTVRKWLPPLAKKVLVPLLRPPKKRRESRLVAIAVSKSAQVYGAQKAVLAGVRWMREKGHALEGAPTEVQTFVEDQ